MILTYSLGQQCIMLRPYIVNRYAITSHGNNSQLSTHNSRHVPTWRVVRMNF